MNKLVRIIMFCFSIAVVNIEANGNTTYPVCGADHSAPGQLAASQIEQIQHLLQLLQQLISIQQHLATEPEISQLMLQQLTSENEQELVTLAGWISQLQELELPLQELTNHVVHQLLLPLPNGITH